VPTVLKSGSLNLLEPSGPVQACNGIAFPFYKYKLLLDVQYVLTITKASSMSKLEGLLTCQSLEDALVEILDANKMNQRMEAARFPKRRYITYLPVHSVTSHKKSTFAVISLRI